MVTKPYGKFRLSVQSLKIQVRSTLSIFVEMNIDMHLFT